MRCNYCRSMTHDQNCPKELADKILPIYSAVHKLTLIETRCRGQQTDLYALAEGKGMLEQVQTGIKLLVEGENAKNAVVKEMVGKTSKKSV